jgi:hypothetical protein
MSNGAITLEAIDGASGRPVPARVHLTDETGRPVAVSGLPYFHDHFVIPGSATIPVPAGSYHCEIERGPEFGRFTTDIAVSGDEIPRVAARIQRLINMPEKGWWPGELHVHRPIEDIELLMRAEELHVAPVITWWNRRNLWQDRRRPENPLVPFDGNRFYHAMGGEDEREGGAFLYLNRSEPLDISEADREYPPLIANLDRVRDEAGTWIDIEKPFWWDVPVALAHGFGHSIGVANNHMCRSTMRDDEAWGKPRDKRRLPSPHGVGYWTQEIYYHILNCGIRISPSAGSASGVLPNPVGYNRVYVHLPGAPTYEAWWQGLRDGRSFVTNGPMLVVSANGELPGAVFRSPGGGPVDVEITVDVFSADPIPGIQVIKNGRIERVTSFDEWRRSGSLGQLRFVKSGWFLVRAIADHPKTFRFASSAPYYVEVGKEAKPVSKQSAQFFVNWVNERIGRVKHDDAVKLENVLAYQRRALEFWTKRLQSATAD